MEWFWGKPKEDGVYLFGGISPEHGAVNTDTLFVYRGDTVPEGWWCWFAAAPADIEGGASFEVPRTPVTHINNEVEEMVQTVPDAPWNPAVKYQQVVVQVHTAINGVPTGQTATLAISARDAEEVLTSIHEKMESIRTDANNKVRDWRGMELMHLLSGWYGQMVDRPE